MKSSAVYIISWKKFLVVCTSLFMSLNHHWVVFFTLSTEVVPQTYKSQILSEQSIKLSHMKTQSFKNLLHFRFVGTSAFSHITYNCFTEDGYHVDTTGSHFLLAVALCKELFSRSGRVEPSIMWIDPLRGILQLPPNMRMGLYRLPLLSPKFSRMRYLATEIKFL